MRGGCKLLTILPGIGRSTAFAFARAGVSGLVLVDINTKALKQTVGEVQKLAPSLEIRTLELDVSNEKSTINCMDQAFKAFGRIDYAVNNIGIGGNHFPTIEQDREEFDKVIGVNLAGLWSCQREQVKHMLIQDIKDKRYAQARNPISQQLITQYRAGRGVITNTASILGLVGGPPGASPYVASKHAVIGITRNVSMGSCTCEWHRKRLCWLT